MCVSARIPEIEAKKSLRDILEWSLHVLTSWRPKFKFKPPGDSGELELDLFGSVVPIPSKQLDEVPAHSLPKYVNDIKQSLEAVLAASGLSLWLMVDRLDEIFPRRSDVMLEQVVRTEAGFTALTHVTVREADTLRWTQDQILAMVIKRFCANDGFATYLGINRDQLEASASYRMDCFDKIFTYFSTHENI